MHVRSIDLLRGLAMGMFFGSCWHMINVAHRLIEHVRHAVELLYLVLSLLHPDEGYVNNVTMQFPVFQTAAVRTSLTGRLQLWPRCPHDPLQTALVGTPSHIDHVMMSNIAYIRRQE